MARTAGRNSVLYVALASGGSAEPIAYLTSWSASFSADRTDVTAMGDTNKVYLAGLPDSQGDFAGFYDTSSAQLFTAATDGVARKFYAYADTTAPTTNYWYGTAFFDMRVNATVNGAVEVSGSWAASGTVSKK